MPHSAICKTIASPYAVVSQKQRIRLLNNTRVFGFLPLVSLARETRENKNTLNNAREEEEEGGSLQTFACTPMAKHCDANPWSARQEAGKTNYPPPPPLPVLGDN